MKIINGNEIEGFIKELEARRDDIDLTIQVKKILETVKAKGDQALYEFTEAFDDVKLSELFVSKEAWTEGVAAVDADLYNSLLKAAENIENYHKIQLRESQFINVPGGRLGELIKPLKRVGIYVPGGKAAYPSTVLMNAIPAKLAGVQEVIMVTPPMKNGQIKPSVLAAAKIAGVDKIIKVGGAQGVAALAYGTESIEPVNKIVGPGNAYVATAKGLVSNRVGIDMIAGPSEILILADESANVSFIVADLISQAEHDERAAAIVVTTSVEQGNAIRSEMKARLENVPRQSIVQTSINNEGAIIVVKNRDELVAVANKIAPEHLEIMTDAPEDLVDQIENAGAIFVGQYSPEPLGDYFAGPNHTLPTSGTAMFSSPLGIDDFIKKTSYIRYTKEGLEAVKDDIINIANDEGLYGHANAIAIRFGGKYES